MDGQLGFFDTQSPLAHRMRPRTLEEYAGQRHLMAEGKPLYRILQGHSLPSLILWGPPGTGKTTLARLIAQRYQATFVSFSAVTGGLPELREHIKEAQTRRRMGQKTILFVDEIHRFNKGQQDAFLPYVEDGTVILVGATTENPSFELNAALLSRARVFALQSLEAEDLQAIVLAALTDPERGLGLPREKMDDEALEALITLSDGDARRALNTLEVVAEADRITKVGVAEAIAHSARYDKSGDEHYNIVSAFIKSLRGTDPDAALYWLARMIDGGEDPLFIARRLVISASEDVGNGDPHALMVATSAMQAVQLIGMPEGRIPLAQATCYIASAPKSNAAYMGINRALSDVKSAPQPPVPIHLRNAPTKLMAEMGYGKDYKYPHDFGGFVTQSYWPDQMPPRHYYAPTENGFEAQIKKRLSALRFPSH